MAQVRPTWQYRHVLRELRKASISSRATRSPVIATQFRSLFEQAKDSANEARFSQDIENALTFMRAQRVHKELLERYNPLFDLTAEERIEATARRVGLNMPIQGKDE